VADERWRALERRWQQTGAVADEAALLAERVRAGDLSEARVRLVAWLGHEAAGPGFDTSALVDAAALRGAERAFWRGVVGFGPETAVRAALALARRSRRQIDEVLQGITAKGRRPTESVLAWGRAASQCVDSAVSWVLAPTALAREVLERDVARATSAEVPPGQVVRDLATAVQILTDLADGGDGRPWSDVATAQALDDVRAALRLEVVPWALGLRDPLREEVERRLSEVSKIRIASPCHVTWDSMREVEGDARVRLCERCDQQVFDLNRLALEEAEEIVRARERGQRVCVRLYRRTDGSVLLRDCPVGLDARVEPDPLIG
jgi:hypothetical protein